MAKVEESGVLWSAVEQKGASVEQGEGVGNMFLNTYNPKLDAKGRFFLPAKFRDELTEGLVITMQQERCLAIYPKAVFERKAMEALQAPGTVARNRALQRMLAASASDETPDSQGRLTIPPKLREYASLDTELAVVGAIDRVEVWDKAAWEDYSAEQEATFADINEEIFPL